MEDGICQSCGCGNVSIGKEEVIACLKKAKNGKSPGPGDICMELLKYGGDSV